MELEGLRGIAAIVVVFYHNLLAFYALAFFGVGSALAPIQNEWFETELYGTPFSALFSGTFAVAIFFVLSGFVLSIGFFQTGKSQIIKSLAIKRYLRLMIPALASILLCYVLMKIGVSHAQSAALITHSGWLDSGWNFTPNLSEAIWSGVVSIFSVGHNPYNNVLWTMTTEFVGSFIVFGFLLLFAHSKYRWIVYCALIVILFNTWLIGFIVGLIIADMYRLGMIVRAKRGIFTIVGLLAAGIFFGGYPMGTVKGTMYEMVTQLPFTTINYQILFTTTGAAVIVFSAIWVTQISKILEKKQISIIGKYTFSLYLIHLSVLYTFTTGIFMLLYQSIGYSKAAVLAMTLSIPVVWMLTILFEKFIDRPSIKMASYYSDIYSGKRDLNIAGLKKNILSMQIKMTSWSTNILQRSIKRFNNSETEL
jgi:peptidoglycan/LPS O-acetylase OafA/YrhL